MLIQEKKARVFATRLAGVSYENRQAIVQKLTNDTPLLLKREPLNPYDKNAIAVYACFSKDEQKIGYIPREIAKDLAFKMDQGVFVLIQFLEKKQEQYNAMDYNEGHWMEWGFTGVVVGIMC